jgi:hypothetical protein
MTLPYLTKSHVYLNIPKELFFVLAFIFMLIIFAMFDPGVNLYNEDYTQGISEYITNIHPTFYVLRNALLYVPMICYLAMRGIVRGELKVITGIVAVVSPLSIIGYLYKIGFFPTFSLMSFVAFGDEAKLEWNSYVPYLTFSFISSMYLVMSLRSKVFKSLFVVIGLFAFLFMLASASRQSVAFCVISLLWYVVSTTRRNRPTVVMVIVGLCFVVYGVIRYTAARYNINYNLISRYSSMAGYIETSRFDIMKRGIELIGAKELLFGAGLSSVIVSGPHNDFIRWTQRIGFPAMIISFTPFIISLSRIVRSMSNQSNLPVLQFLSMAIVFTLFHSFFGYPREDAYQAVYAYLGLGLWLGIAIRKN